MTNEEAKKAGFRTASGALYVYWCIENGHIYVRSCDACALTWNDFQTRAKAREALRKRKENEEVNRKSRFIDNFVQPMQEHLSSKSKADAEHAKWLADMQSQTAPITPEQAKMLREGDRIYGFKYGCVDAEHLVCFENPVTVGCVDDIGIIKAGKAYFTLAAAQAALDKAKCSTLPEGVAPVPEGYEFVDPNKIEIVMVDSKTYIFDVEEKRWHLLNGFNSGLMVSTKWNLEHGIYFARPKAEAEPQDKEPVKYAERKRGEIVQAGDEVLYAGCDWHSASHELGAQAMGVLGDYSCPTATRYLTPEWKAWAARQDIKESNKEPVAPVEVIPTNASESAKLSNKPDAVSHPSHYTSHPSGVECITITKHMNFCRGNAVKYL